MAMSLEQAQEMVVCAEKNKRILMIGFNRRYAPVYEWAKAEGLEHLDYAAIIKLWEKLLDLKISGDENE
jgi:hypothetical protein